MDVRNRGCKSLVEPEKESTIPTVILEGSFLLPAQPWKRGEQGACVNWRSLLHAGPCGSKVECQKHREFSQNVSRLKTGRLEEEEDGLSSG